MFLQLNLYILGGSCTMELKSNMRSHSTLSLKKKLENYSATLTFPSEINVTFDALFGLEKEKQVMFDIIKYVSNKQQILPHFSYCILGEIGTGKASLVYATCKAANIPAIAIDANDIIAMDHSFKKLSMAVNTIYDLANNLAKKYGACSVMFKNAQEFELLNNDSIFFASLLKNITKSKDVFSFVLATSDGFEVPACLAENHLFATILYLEIPNLETREKIITHLFSTTGIKLAQDVSVERLAKDTFGETPLKILYIFKEATLYAHRQNRESVTSDDFSETIMKLSDGEKKEMMTEKEKLATAYHEAGHVIAGYFSRKDYMLKRVEITPRTLSLGLTATDVDEKKHSYFKEDFECDIIELLGGLCAEEIIYGSHTSGVVSDLAYATATASNMVRAYGMSSELGILQVIQGVTDSALTLREAEISTMKILNTQKEKTFDIIRSHLPYLEALANALVEKEVVMGNEIEELFKNVTSSLKN